VAAGIDDGPDTLGTAKGVDCGCGVGFGEALTDGVFEGEGDCVEGVVGRVEVDGGGGGVWAHSNAARPESAASAESKRTPAFNEFRISWSERMEYTAI
jgi:hypothetical protein